MANNRLSGITVFVCLAVQLIFATSQLVQPRRLVDAHTAGILRRGQYDLECRVHPAGNSRYGSGVTIGIDVGITDRLTIGLSYGGEGVVGRGPDIKPHPQPGWLVKYRLFEEGFAMPGFALGYDHQGHGGRADTSEFFYEGYIYKSPGFFLAVSKNFILLNTVQFGIHGSCTYSMEDVDNVTWPNMITGLDIGVNEELFLVMEYDFGFNCKDPRENRKTVYANPAEGYFNAGIRWAFSPSLYVEFDAHDILENRRTKNGAPVSWDRELRLIFFSEF